MIKVVKNSLQQFKSNNLHLSNNLQFNNNNANNNNNKKKKKKIYSKIFI